MLGSRRTGIFTIDSIKQIEFDDLELRQIILSNRINRNSKYNKY